MVHWRVNLSTYNHSQLELEVLCKYINKILGKRFIISSKLPAGALVLFTKKKNGRLRLYVDYRSLNTITKKNKHLLPLVQTFLDLFGRKKEVYKNVDRRTFRCIISVGWETPLWLSTVYCNQLSSSRQVFSLLIKFKHPSVELWLAGSLSSNKNSQWAVRVSHLRDVFWLSVSKMSSNTAPTHGPHRGFLLKKIGEYLSRHLKVDLRNPEGVQLLWAVVEYLNLEACEEAVHKNLTTLILGTLMTIWDCLGCIKKQSVVKTQQQEKLWKMRE